MVSLLLLISIAITDVTVVDMSDRSKGAIDILKLTELYGL